NRKVSEIMKNTTKRIIAVLSAATIALSASIAMADAEHDVMLISAKVPQLYVNDTLLENATIHTADDKQFIPLRAICEALGFTVNWINESRTIEIVDLPLYVTCSPDRDGYTFARTAPMLLGSAPLLIDDTTYVPLNFVDEIIKHELRNENGNIYISTPVEKVEVSGEIVELIYDENDVLVQIVTGDKEDPMNQLIFNLSEELSAKAAELGLEVGITFKGLALPLQTMSIPAQQPLVEITELVTSEPTVETVDVTAEIVELVYDENETLVQIVTGDKEDPMQQLIFNLSEELSANASELGLEVGKTISGKAVAMQTMSIPAQQPLVEITEVK
ncbi:MAG: copper amine oxidase N-terminal domain-containing protein, partial [Clostridia bacterium]|nr:copper amine oxidase N-terminal domain-containing protein [Clostridia bacterium]